MCGHLLLTLKTCGERDAVWREHLASGVLFDAGAVKGMMNFGLSRGRHLGRWKCDGDGGRNVQIWELREARVLIYIPWRFPSISILRLRAGDRRGR